jgi:hypothetical protein
VGEVKEERDRKKLRGIFKDWKWCLEREFTGWMNMISA